MPKNYLRRAPTLPVPLDETKLISDIKFHFDKAYIIQAKQIEEIIKSGELFALEGDQTYVFFYSKKLASVSYPLFELMKYDNPENFIYGVKIAFLSRKKVLVGNDLDKLPEAFKTYLLNNVKLLAS